MAEILSLPKRRRPKPLPAEGEKTGEIVFFTGVRYQRAEVPAPAPGRGGKPGMARGKSRARRA